MSRPAIRIGTAGWTLPAASRERFPDGASHLQRYAARFACVEINSSFYRPHRPSTYARWAASVPADFRFSLKMPKEITHTRRFVACVEPLDAFLHETSALGERRGPLLVQLPPSFAFDDATVRAFFAVVRERYDGPLVCEPRHPTWFEPAAEDALRAFTIVRVAADPAVVPAAAEPGGADAFVYYRLHGSPRVYYSPYEADALMRIAATLRACTVPVWCIFDNTAFGVAAGNALDLTELLA